MPIKGIDQVADLHDQEQALFSSIDEAPMWITVNAARRLINREAIEASERLAGNEGLSIDEMSPLQAHQHAVVHLAAIAGRSSGAAISLIACGYLPEAKVDVRRLVECTVRAIAVVDDQSGEHGKAWLSGRPIGKISRLGRRYGKKDFMKRFSNTAHADVDGFLLLADVGEGSSKRVNIAPQRDKELTKLFFTLITGELYILTCSLLDLFVGYQPSPASLQEMIDVRKGMGIQVPLTFPWPVEGLGAYNAQLTTPSSCR